MKGGQNNVSCQLKNVKNYFRKPTLLEERIGIEIPRRNIINFFNINNGKRNCLSNEYTITCLV